MLAREYRPSNIIRLVPREKYQPRSANDGEQKKKRRLHDTMTLTERKQKETAARLVESLIEQTPSHKQHAVLVGSSKPNNNTYEQFAAPMPHKKRNLPPIPHAFHEIELGDWESQIHWNGVPKEFAKPVDPMALLRQPRNHHLDCLDFSDAIRPHTKEELLEKARNVPLVLELGVAGQSVANVVYQNTALYATRPTSALKSEAYKQRVERSLHTNSSKDGKSSNAKSLQSAKDEKMAEYEARQNKRAQMAEDKTARVKEAMGTMTLGGGRGRTVTSSLMGPGGMNSILFRSDRVHSTTISCSSFVQERNVRDDPVAPWRRAFTKSNTWNSWIWSTIIPWYGPIGPKCFCDSICVPNCP